MNAAIAAILASGITATVALGVGLLAPYLTARHAREAKLLEMQRDTFVKALAVVNEAAGSADPAHIRAVAAKMAHVTVTLVLLTNVDVANLYGAVGQALLAHANAIETRDHTKLSGKAMVEAQAEFIKAARGFMALPEPPS